MTMDNGQCREASADYQSSIDHSPLDEVPAGYKRTEVGVIPEDWTISGLEALGKRVKPAIKAGPFGSSLKKDSYVKEGYKVYGQEQVIRGDYLYGDYFIDERKFRDLESCAVGEGDILLSLVGTTGKLLVLPKGAPPGIINPRLIRLSFDEQKILPVFFKYLFQSVNVQNELSRLAQGGTMDVLNARILRMVKVQLPSVQEQRAIATALSDVDALITALDKLIAKKRAIKTAAMQQLLTGKARLPGFSGEWETKRLGEVCDIRKGELITASTAKPGIIPVIGGGTSVSYCHDTPNRAANTITISASGANAGYVAFHDYPIFASDCSTIEEGEVYDIKFIYYLLSNYQKTLTSLQTGGAQPHVYPEQLAPLSFAFPEQPEQTAIAQVLSDMDAEIATLEARRDKTRAIKQGMMQQVLTGRVRLVKPEMEAC